MCNSTSSLRIRPKRTIKPTLMKAIFIVCALLLSLSELNAQNYTPPNKAALKDYRNNPKWIDMMKDTSANYYTTTIAFDEFWKGKPNPIELMEHGEGEEHDHEGEEHEGEEYEKVSEREREELIKYAMDYKQFKFWQMQHKGFLHPDGTIMNEKEIQALAQQELQRRQNSNK